MSSLVIGWRVLERSHVGHQFSKAFGDAGVISDAISHGDFNRILYRYEKRQSNIVCNSCWKMAKNAPFHKKSSVKNCHGRAKGSGIAPCPPPLNTPLVRPERALRRQRVSCDRTSRLWTRPRQWRPLAARRCRSRTIQHFVPGRHHRGSAADRRWLPRDRSYPAWAWCSSSLPTDRAPSPTRSAAHDTSSPATRRVTSSSSQSSFIS